MPTNLLMTSTWTIQSQNTAYAGRLHDQAFLAMTSATAVRDGVLVSHTATGTTPTDLKITQSTPTANRVLNVAAGACVVTRSGQSVYKSVQAAAGTVQIDVANATNPRIDLVIVRLYDQATNGTDAQTRAQIEVVTGTPAVSPVAPYSLIPAGVGYIPLAEVAVAANATPANTAITDANITDKRKSAAVRGAIRRLLPGDSVADAGAYDGEYSDTGSAFRRWNSATASWQTFALTGSAEFIQGTLKRSDNTFDLNAGNTDLGVFSSTSFGGTWATNFSGRGVSCAKSGLYEVHAAIYPAPGDTAGLRYVTLSAVSSTPAETRILGAGTGTGHDYAGGTCKFFVPSGLTFGVVFQANNNKPAGTLNAAGTPFYQIQRVGEAV